MSNGNTPIDWSCWEQVKDIYAQTLTPDVSDNEDDWEEGEAPVFVIPAGWETVQVQMGASGWDNTGTPS